MELSHCNLIKCGEIALTSTVDITGEGIQKDGQSGMGTQIVTQIPINDLVKQGFLKQIK